MRALAIVLVLGCGGGSKSAATMPAAAPATCAAVADAMVALVVEGRDNVEEEAAKLSAMIRTRCDEDAWSADARQCLAAVKTAADADRCGTLLTEEQQQHLVRDQEAGQKKPEEPPAAAEQPAPAAVMPPPAPVEAEKQDKKEPARRKKAAKPANKAPAPDRRQGDPCDGGE